MRRAMMVAPAVGGGGGSPFPVSPLAWYKPDTDLFTDAGSTPVTSDGDLVYQWNDQSGNGYHLVQTTSGNRPFYRPGTTDDRGEKAVGFERSAATTGRYLNFPDALATALNAAKQAEIFVKFKNRLSNTDPNASGWMHLGGSSQEELVCYADGNMYDDIFLTSRVGPFSPAVALDSAFRLYNAACFDSSLGTGTWDVWIETSNRVNSTGTVTFSVDASGNAFGTSRSGNKMDAYVTEIVIFASKLGSSDRTTVNTYFGL